MLPANSKVRCCLALVDLINRRTCRFGLLGMDRANHGTVQRRFKLFDKAQQLFFFRVGAEFPFNHAKQG